jgi:hypothetical protein
MRPVLIAGLLFFAQSVSAQAIEQATILMNCPANSAAGVASIEGSWQSTRITNPVSIRVLEFRGRWVVEELKNGEWSGLHYNAAPPQQEDMYWEQKLSYAASWLSINLRNGRFLYVEGTAYMIDEKRHASIMHAGVCTKVSR